MTRELKELQAVAKEIGDMDIEDVQGTLLTSGAVTRLKNWLSAERGWTFRAARESTGFEALEEIEEALQEGIAQ